MQRQEVRHRVLDLDLQEVDLPVAGDHLLGRLRLAVQDRAERLPQGVLDLAGHGQQPILEPAQLVVKVPVGLADHPNLPVK